MKTEVSEKIEILNLRVNETGGNVHNEFLTHYYDIGKLYIMEGINHYNWGSTQIY